MVLKRELDLWSLMRDLSWVKRYCGFRSWSDVSEAIEKYAGESIHRTALSSLHNIYIEALNRKRNGIDYTTTMEMALSIMSYGKLIILRDFCLAMRLSKDCDIGHLADEIMADCARYVDIRLKNIENLIRRIGDGKESDSEQSGG